MQSKGFKIAGHIQGTENCLVLLGGELRSMNLILEAKGSRKGFEACKKKWSDVWL